MKIRVVFRLSAVAVCFALLCAGHAPAATNCTINTGLDPACPLTAAGVQTGTAVFDSAATQRDDDLFASLALRADAQISVALPLYQHLGVAGAGEAYGSGNLALGYTRAFGGKKRLTQFAGLDVDAAIGSTSFPAAARSQLAPLYGVSYAIGRHISLVTTAQYTFDVGGTRIPFAPMTQQLSVVPRAIVDLSKSGLYTAFGIAGSSVTGQERYQAYQSDAVLGIARPRFALSATYSIPIAYYTYHHVFNHAFGFQFSLKR